MGSILVVSLGFFVNLILPVALRPWTSTHAVAEMGTRVSLGEWGIKAAGVYG